MKYQKIKPNIESLDYRIDILRLTFKIEELLEIIIKRIFSNKKRILEPNFEKFFISQKEYQDFKKYYNELLKKKDFKSIWNKKTQNPIFFNTKNFINLSTFGQLIKSMDKIKSEKIKATLNHIAPNLEQVEVKVFKKWMVYVKNVRNTLAHRTYINPNNFLIKTQMPVQSKNFKTTNLTALELKKKIFSLFIPIAMRDNKTKIILEKYMI